VTKREFVLKGLNNEETLGAPVGLWFHHLPEERWGDGLTDPEVLELNINGHKKFIREFRPDFVKIMSDGFFFPPAAPVREVSDLNSIEEAGSNHEWIEKQVYLVKQVCGTDRDLAYFYNIFSPLTTLRFMIGAERLLSFIASSPESVSKAVCSLGTTLSRLAGRVISEGGADGIYFSVQNPDIERISDDFYAACFSSADLLVLNAAGGEESNNILHICGYDGVRNRLPAWKSYPAKAYNWAVNVEGVSLKEGKELFSGKAVIGGFANPKGSLIDSGRREEIIRFVKTLLEETGRRGVIIGADCTVTPDLAPERLDWIREGAV
jgi:uroporphyrinogen decarboxylase